MLSRSIVFTSFCSFFFFNDTATTEIYTLSLHDALPISARDALHEADRDVGARRDHDVREQQRQEHERDRLHKAPRIRSTLDRKSTRLNSSHGYISYAVFCLKKKKKQIRQRADTV